MDMRQDKELFEAFHSAWDGDDQELLDELAEAGFRVGSAFDLLNRKVVWDLTEEIPPYDSAHPVLFEHLKRPYDSYVREGIARALIGVRLPGLFALARDEIKRLSVDHKGQVGREVKKAQGRLPKRFPLDDLRDALSHRCEGIIWLFSVLLVHNMRPSDLPEVLAILRSGWVPWNVRVEISVKIKRNPKSMYSRLSEADQMFVDEHQPPK